MDVLLANQNPQSCLSSLGSLMGETYMASDNCLEVLKDIYQRLITEDKVARTFRRSIHFSQGLQKDIVPLLISTQDTEIAGAVVRILACLLVPVECLLPLELMTQTEVGRIIVFELKSFLVKSKTAFRDPRSTKAIIEIIKSNINLDGNKKLIGNECEAINNCLLVLRNVLHIPEVGRMHKNLQNCIVWNLFVQNIDQVLLHLMTSENKTYWSVAIVQLIAVLYKDQHVGTLQKLLHGWFEGSLTESSEDNESNTTPDQRSSSSPIMSSELTSDSSEASGKNIGSLESSSGVPHVSSRHPQPGSTQDDSGHCGKMLAFEDSTTDRKSPSNPSSRTAIVWRSRDDDNGTTTSGHSSATSKGSSSHHRSSQRSKNGDTQKKMEAAGSATTAPEYSDYGYVSHAETPEAISTSSNEEEAMPTKRPFHQKPHIQKTRYCNKQPSPQEKKEVRRKKLMKRSKNTLMNMKSLVNHVPRDEDITHVLKEFTIGFLLTGYEPLVTALHTELLTPSSGLPIDTSHFFWLLTYFLKFAGQLELDLDQVRGVLSFRVLSYLVYDGVSITEQVEQTAHIDADLKSALRRQHLVVTSIREFILSLEAYDKVSYLSLKDKEDVKALHGLISSSDDLKRLFVLMLRLYKPDVHSRQFLEDLVVTNHILLSFVEQQNDSNAEKMKTPISEHLKQFATVGIMKHYGLLLEDFQSNGEFINDCVFTMMHHIAGDINYVASLCQPNILKTFTQIWESDFELCEDWSDLIEYVIHRFVSIPRRCPILACSTIPAPLAPAEDTGWSKEECENLYWYFAMSSSGTDLIADIIKLYKEAGVVKTRIAVIEQLFKQGVVSNEQYKQLLSEETSDDHSPTPIPVTIPPTPNLDTLDEVSALRDILVIDGHGAKVTWLQKLLLDTRHSKLVLQQEPGDYVKHRCEPVSYYFSLLNQSIPVVSWNCEMEMAMRNKTFQALVRQLGFHLPSETAKLFLRIPSFWTPDILLSVAQKLGPIDMEQLEHIGPQIPVTKSPNFEEEKDGDAPMPFAVPRPKQSASLVNFTPLPNVPSSWLDVVKKSKSSVAPLNFSELGGKDGEATADIGEDQALRPKASSDLEDLECASVLSVCDTQASDLTRMYISDEDEEGNRLHDWS